MNVATREQAHAWDLRGAWAGRWPVIVRIEEAADIIRLAGYVEHVSSTGAYAVLLDIDEGPVHVPCAAIVATRRPHFHEPGDARLRDLPPPEGPRRGPDPIPGQLQLVFDPEQAPLPF